MYRVTAEKIVAGELADVWELATDVARWATWDPHEEAARIDGPFAVGTAGWSKPRGGPPAEWTLTDVVEQHRWSSTCRAPGTRLDGVNTYEQVAPGQVRCTKTFIVTGLLVPLFRVWFGPRIRRDAFATFAALEQEVARIAA